MRSHQQLPPPRPAEHEDPSHVGQQPTPLARRRGTRCRKATMKYLEFLGPDGRERLGEEAEAWESSPEALDEDRGQDVSEGRSNGSWDSSAKEASTEEEEEKEEGSRATKGAQKQGLGTCRGPTKRKVPPSTGVSQQKGGRTCRNVQGGHLKRRKKTVVPKVAKRSKKCGKAVLSAPGEVGRLNGEGKFQEIMKAIASPDTDQICSPEPPEAASTTNLGGGRLSVSGDDAAMGDCPLEPVVQSASIPSVKDETHSNEANHGDGMAKSSRASSDHEMSEHQHSDEPNSQVHKQEAAWDDGANKACTNAGAQIANTHISSNGNPRMHSIAVAKELLPTVAWLHEFVKCVEGASNYLEGYRMEPVSRLLRLHPELLGLLKNNASSTSTNDDWHYPLGSEKQTDLFISKLKAAMNANTQSRFDFRSWLHETAIRSTSMPPSQRGTHWQWAQKYLLAKTLKALPHELEKLAHKYSTEAEDRVHLTSGVSYILPSESSQEGVSEVARLSHTVIQPPSLLEVSSHVVSTSIDVVKHEEAAVVLLPIRDDACMKEYLLSPSRRESIINSTPGARVTTLKGLGALNGILHDGLLICCHYKRLASGCLRPCAAYFSPTDLDPSDDTGAPGINDGNIEIAIIVRKGIGGTCPLRAAARALEARGYLPLLLGTIPSNLIEALPSKNCRAESSPIPCDIHTGRIQNGSQVKRANSPYKLVPTGAEPELLDVPPAEATTVGEWFVPIQASASLILDSLYKRQATERVNDAHESVAAAHISEDAGDHKLFSSLRRNSTLDSNELRTENKGISKSSCGTGTHAQTKSRKKSGRKGESSAVNISQACIQVFLEGGNFREEVDELLHNMKSLDKGREEGTTGTLAMSKLLMYTLSCRLEVFVHEDDWKIASGHEKNELYSIVRGTEAWLAARFKEWNSLRLKEFAEILLDTVRFDALFSDVLDQAMDVTEVLSSKPGTTHDARNRKAACVSSDNGQCKFDGVCDDLMKNKNRSECSNDPQPRRKTRRLSSFNRTESKKGEDVQSTTRAVSDAGEGACEDECCDFASQLVKLAACASCLGSMFHISVSDFPWPYYFISTRDCFTYQLVPIRTKVECDGRGYVMTEYYFQPGELPENYHQVVKEEMEIRTVGACSAPEDPITPNRPRHSRIGKKPIQTPTSVLHEICSKDTSEGNRPSDSKMEEHVCQTQSTCNSNLRFVCDKIPEGAHPVGVTTYTQVFNDTELKQIESEADDVQRMAQDNLLPGECFHDTFGRGGNLKRTKFFFGARYLWTKEQLADPNSKQANGVRMDVPVCPVWMRSLVEHPLVDCQIIPLDFVNSWALNMYHDGSEGIQSHFDDSVRFMRPIYSLRLFSDSRLSFGTQLYGYTNGSFYIPMPRGCITVMQEGSYAADGAKHCVRPIDMQGKNAGLIMRRINPEALEEAWKFHLEESTLWLKSLALEDGQTIFKNRKCRVIGEEGNTKGLIRGVIRGVHQDAVHIRKSQQKEWVAVKRVLDGIIRKIEQQAQRDSKQYGKGKRVESQVHSVTERMVRRLEKCVADGREILQPQLDKKHSVQQVNRLNKSKTFEWLLSIAKEIMETVTSEDSEVLQAGRELLQKFGMSWISAHKEKLDHKAATAPSSAYVLEQASRTMDDTSNLKSKAPHPILFELPPLVTVTGHISTTRDWLGNPLKQQRPLQGLPRREFVRSISTMLRSAPTAINGSKEIVPVMTKRPYSTRGSRRNRKFVDYDMSNSEDGHSSSHESYLVEDDEPALEDDAGSMLEMENDSVGRKWTRMSESMQKSLVKEVLATVLKSVSQSVASQNTSNGAMPVNSVDQNLKFENLMEKVQKILNRINWNVERIPSKLISPKKAKGGAGAIGLDEGKRRYKLVPWCVCFECEKQGVDPLQPSTGKNDPLPSDETLMWQCHGKCRRSFHFSCRSSSDTTPGHCSDCASEKHRCLICGRDDSELGKVVKCSMGVCGKFYHPECVLSNPVTNVLQGTWMPVGNVDDAKKGMRFRCPQHYCRVCGLSGANIYSVSCIRCPHAYHSRCCPPGCRRLSKKLVLCAEHDSK